MHNKILLSKMFLILIEIKKAELLYSFSTLLAPPSAMYKEKYKQFTPNRREPSSLVLLYEVWRIRRVRTRTISPSCMLSLSRNAELIIESYFLFVRELGNKVTLTLPTCVSFFNSLIHCLFLVKMILVVILHVDYSNCKCTI